MMEFPITKKALSTLEKVMVHQDEYGMNKYGEPLSYKQPFGWLEMAIEEQADGLKYLQCEMERKKEVIHVLKMGLNSDVPKEFIDLALELLTIGGTGK